MNKIQALYQLPCNVEGIHDYDNPGTASQELFDTGIKILQYLQNLVKSFQIAEEAGWEYIRYKSGIIYLIPSNQGKEAIDNTLRAMGLICGENSEECPVYNIAKDGKSPKLAVQQVFLEKIDSHIKLSGNLQEDIIELKVAAVDYFKWFADAAGILSILESNGWGWSMEQDSLMFNPPKGISRSSEIEEALMKQGFNPKDFDICDREVVGCKKQEVTQ